MQRYFKRVLVFLTATIMAMSIELPSGMFSSLSSLVTAKAATVTATKPSGDGSADSPFQIGKYSELVWFQQYVDAGNTGANAVLTADITANKNLFNEDGSVSDVPVYKWNSIGGDSKVYYTGTFDGNGHIISGLYSYRTDDYCGLFAKMGGTIKNLGIVDSYFGGKNCYHASSFAGVGYSSSVIENCFSDSSVVGSYYCGGIAGATEGKISNCYYIGKITASSTNSNAIVSDYYNKGTVENCYYSRECSLTSSRAEAKSKEQFSSGEVCFLLNNEVTDGSQAWYQTLGTDAYPQFSGKTVYYISEQGKKVYSNYDVPALENGAYQLSNYGELVWFQQYVDAGNTGANAVLTADITANKNLFNEDGSVSDVPVYKWNSIGGDSKVYYTGTFDGNGHIISGLYSYRTDDYCGLFAMMKGTIKNLGIVDSYFGGTKHVASFAGYGYPNSVIENCFSDSSVVGSMYCGGIAGETTGKISNCYYIGKITANSKYSNAIVSDYYNEGTVENCYYSSECSLTSSRAEAKSREQFSSGEVCYLLNNEVTDGSQAWYQTIGTDRLPKFNGKTVYYIQNLETQKYEYSNTCPHIDYDENGFCKSCGAGKEPTAVNGVYQIANRGNWEWVAQKVNSGAKATVNAKLIANVDMGGATVTKIGLNETNTFTGSFDGGNYTISNFVVDADGDTYDNGLFGYVENATIKNLNVSSTLKLNANNSDVSNNNHAYSGFVAHLTGNSALIENCNVNTTINIATSGNYNRVGLIASNVENGATVRNCQSSGTIKSTSTKYNLVNCGGIVGRVSKGTIENCVSNVDYNNTINRADDTDISIYNIGGIVGCSGETNTIKNCTSKGNMAFDCTDTDIKQIGGIVGYVEESGTLNIGNCTNDGDITITSRRSSKTNIVESVGGILGYAEEKTSTSNITSCQNNGAVTVQGDSSSIPSGKEVNVSYVGGIVGRSGYNATLLYCLNTGAVTLTDIIPNQHAGIVGYASYKSNLKIENCGNTGNITCQTKLTTPNAGNGCTAGILGYINNATNGAFKGINNCFNTGTITSYLNNAASLIGQMRGSINLSTELTNYYLKQSGVNPICYNSNNLNITSVAKTKDQFESGEVTYLLNKKVTDGTQAWYQNIGTDKTPMFSGGTVYYGYNSATDSMEYSNTFIEGDCPHNLYENGFCKACGKTQEPQKSKDGVYQLANYGNLVWFQQYVDSGNYNANAILTKDITANENLISDGNYVEANVKYTWTPIAKEDLYDSCYSGTFNGNGHTISGLYVNIGGSYRGFIGQFNGTIKNLYITDSYFGGGDLKRATFAGYGYGSSKIENCGTDAIVVGGGYSGGIVAQTKGTVENCYFAGKITAGSNSNAIVSDSINSYNTGKVTNCYYLDSCGLTSNIATSVTAEQLESGEVTYLLNKKVTDGTQVWYQTIGTDKLPMFSGGIVYYNETASTPYYNFIYTKGDVNNDGNVDKIDVSLVLKHISGSKILNNEKANAADYNGDGKINTLDTIEMLKKIG